MRCTTWVQMRTVIQEPSCSWVSNLRQTIVEQGGLQPGGLNFDAKVRRESTDLEDLFIAHIGAMDAFARGLRNAVRIIEDGLIAGMVKVRVRLYEICCFSSCFVRRRHWYMKSDLWLVLYDLNRSDTRASVMALDGKWRTVLPPWKKWR